LFDVLNEGIKHYIIITDTSLSGLNLPIDKISIYVILLLLF
jgi:hypothetical protein